MKLCSRCGEHKGFNEFHKDPSKPDGFCVACKICRSKAASKRYKSDIEKYRERSRKQSIKFRENSPEKVKEHKRKHRNKIKNTVEYKLFESIRCRFRNALNKNYKSGSAIKNLGCSIEFLKQYLESKFYSHPKTGEMMAWKNRGLYGWHIDHIIPLSSFDLTNEEQLKKACHYSNLQPLWAEENLKKGNKIK